MAKRPSTHKPAKAKPQRIELVRRARLAGLLLETLLSQDEGMLTAAARGKIASAAKLLAEASRNLGRVGRVPTGKARPKAKRRGK